MNATEIAKNLNQRTRLDRTSDRAPLAPFGRCAHCGVPFDRATTDNTCTDCLAVFLAAGREASKPAPVPPSVSALAMNLRARSTVAIPHPVVKVHAQVSEPALVKATSELMSAAGVALDAREKNGHGSPQHVAARAETDKKRETLRSAVETDKASVERERLLALATGYLAMEVQRIPESARPVKALAFAKAWLEADPIVRRAMCLEID